MQKRGNPAQTAFWCAGILTRIFGHLIVIPDFSLFHFKTIAFNDDHNYAFKFLF